MRSKTTGVMVLSGLQPPGNPGKQHSRLLSLERAETWEISVSFVIASCFPNETKALVLTTCHFSFLPLVVWGLIASDSVLALWLDRGSEEGRVRWL